MDKNFEYKFFVFRREEGMYIHIHREAYKLYKYDTAVNHSEAYAYVSPAFPSRLKF